MTQEMNKTFSRVMGNIRYRLFMLSYKICLKTMLVYNRFTIWFVEHPKVIRFIKNIDNYMELYNFFFS